MRQNETEKPTSLTTKQQRALPYLVTAPSVAQGAEEADIARATLYRWMHDPAFRDELERLRGEAAKVAKVELRNYLKILLGESRVPTRRDLVPMSREGMCPPVAKSP